jgi:hypothetical protein
MIYGNVIFAKVSTEETFDYEYIDMNEEEAKAISDAFCCWCNSIWNW